MVVTPHLKVPSSGSSSSMRILNRVVMAISFSATKAILSPRFTRKDTLSQHLHAVHGLGQALHRQDLLARLPVHGLKPTKGYRREEAGISSTVSLSSSLLPGGGLLGLGLVGGEPVDEVPAVP